MKNRTLVTCLRQFNSELIVSISAKLQSGCKEKGYGSGEYEGYGFTQEYTITWNEGYLSAGEYDGYTVGDVIKVLLEKPLSKICHKDFNLRPGELRNGYDTEYETTWKDGEPEELPEDSELYGIMELGETDYEWINAGYIDFEVNYKNQEGKNEIITFVLNEDEIDRNQDPFGVRKNKSATKKKAAKRK